MSKPTLHSPAKTFTQLAENLLCGTFDNLTWMGQELLNKAVWEQYKKYLEISKYETECSNAITTCSDAEHACMYALFIGQFLNKE